MEKEVTSWNYILEKAKTVEMPLMLKTAMQ